MEIDLIFKIAAIGLIVAILSQILSKSDKGEYTMLIALSGIMIVLMMLAPYIKELLETIREIADF